MKKILFICTKNSARSQMAEALVNHDLAGRFEAFSAGTDPSTVHPLAVRAMGEVGIDISNQRSKGLEEFSGKQFDYVVTLCDQANESCPVFFGGVTRLHMGFPDPAEPVNDDDKQLDLFRRVRDQVREKVIGFLTSQERED
jgi:arsenate reductase (thioredoxin)